MPRERARVDSFRAGDVPIAQVFIERYLGAPIAWYFGQFFNNKTAHMRGAAFLIQRVDPVISDQRVCHCHNLPAVGWIGQHFLITGHRRVEANLPDACPSCAKGFTLEISAVFEGYECAHVTAQYQWYA